MMSSSLTTSHHHLPQHQHARETTPNPSRPKTIAGYTIHRRLGSGSFATVHMGTKPLSNGSIQTVAIKAITRSAEKLTKKLLENLEMEIAILRTYRHPNIVCMHDVHKTDKHFFLILEYCGGGDVQKLIRGRKTGRLTERLTRRLMRDLTAGLKFLWSQELIHRDLKPQNLLLTGPLPLDERWDVSKLDSEEEMRRKVNFPSKDFALKIADFGFARHLQTTSLAETLCGSPLYMAPEILQHHRYDAKADLWSVGTVLFEMIAGRPPFHGENHIDLLRNIQRRAVRLPPGVKVSPECVNLLRLLLNRNPLSRAGFQEFFAASDAFVALGYNGDGPNPSHSDLGQVGYMEGEAKTREPDADLRPGAEMKSRKVTASHGGIDRMPMVVSSHHGVPPPTNLVSPTLASAPIPIPPASSIKSTSTQKNQQQPSGIVTRQYSHFTPLAPSPPGPKPTLHTASPLPPPLSLDGSISPNTQQHLPVHMPVISHLQQPERQVPSQQTPLRQDASFEENDFVLVEHGGGHRSHSISPATSQYSGRDSTEFQNRQLRRSGKYSPSSSASRRVYPMDKDKIEPNRHLMQMLSTSPNTGRALVNMMTPSDNSSNTFHHLELEKSQDRELAVKMLAAAEDVGRRAVNIAHLGDTRAYIGMKLMMIHEGNSSLLSSSPMEGVIEQEDDDQDNNMQEHEENSTRSSIKTSLPLGPLPEEDDDDEMPFAVTPRTTNSQSSNKPIVSANSSLTHSKPSRSTMGMIHCHFKEALSCYLKALSLMKGALKAAQLVKDKIHSSQDEKFKTTLIERCELSLSWLGTQFQGVLERADAASHEVKKTPDDPTTPTPSSPAEHPLSAEELIYNHSLSCGRDGAVKQLLGQYDAARTCYRSAGLLAEALLMEPRISDDDRNTLEGYVDGFAERIKDLDNILRKKQQTRAKSVVGIVGGLLPGGYHDNRSRDGGMMMTTTGHPQPLPMPMPPFVIEKRR